MRLDKKYVISGKLNFLTAFRIGSGQFGEVSDLGILRDPKGDPVVPGSTLKGKFRATVERLAHSLDMSACLLDNGLSGAECVSGMSSDDFREANREFRAIKDAAAKLSWIRANTCDVCSLFGSPMHASRIFFSDAMLREWAKIVQVRDGVVIDRDSETAVDGLYYNYETVPAGASFDITIEVVNPSDKDIALIEVGLREWEAGLLLGGATTRGLGRAALSDVAIAGVDFGDDAQRIKYLTEGSLSEISRDTHLDIIRSIVGG